MKNLCFLSIGLILLGLTAGGATNISSAQPQEATPPEAEARHEHPNGLILIKSDDVEWGPGPSSIPEGVEMAVLEGDPRREGLHTFRFRAPDGFRIPPHWHPIVERVTVLKGSFGVGMGEEFDKSKGTEYPAGSYLRMPAKHPHFAWTSGETIIQVTGIGVFEINYINPEDDPRNQ
jgi:hypothetical protein